MLVFKRLTKVNGFDANHPANARQNSYAWSMAELGDYIYVGTCRNMFLNATGFYQANNTVENPNNQLDNNAEIWRYKKDGTSGWQKVFKANPSDQITGIRAMITHKSRYSTAIYAASIGEQAFIFKSTDGVCWEKLDTPELVGKSSRALASFNGKLYVATLDEGLGGNTPHLYVSRDPEFEAFETVIDINRYDFISSQNPMGGIDSLQVFNDHLYVGIETENGAEVWRSRNKNPKTNDWMLVADAGFGDRANRNIMSCGVFKNYLYIAVTKVIPLALFAPLGFDLIRIDEEDNWEVVVGGAPLQPSYPITGIRNPSLSGFNSGFNSFFNVYGWQIKEYQGHLMITTFDNSVNMQAMYQFFLDRQEQLIENIGLESYLVIMKSYLKILYLLDKYHYPYGFDIYQSKDGCHFEPVNLDGLHNPYNYGGRTLHVSSENELYLGTSNPQEGCEVFKGRFIPSNQQISQCYLNKVQEELKQLNRELKQIYPDLIEALEKMFTIQNQ